MILKFPLFLFGQRAWKQWKLISLSRITSSVTCCRPSFIFYSIFLKPGEAEEGNEDSSLSRSDILCIFVGSLINVLIEKEIGGWNAYVIILRGKGARLNPSKSRSFQARQIRSQITEQTNNNHFYLFLAKLVLSTPPKEWSGKCEANWAEIACSISSQFINHYPPNPRA